MPKIIAATSFKVTPLFARIDRAAEQNAIQIHLGAQGWLATYTGPHAKRIGELFNTCTVPTAFTAQASLATVIAAIQARNPGVTVKHWNAA